MTVVKLVLAYDGTDFHGWARQPRHRSVEGELVSAMERLLGVRPRISVAGRTDAGVHASGQVVSLESDLEPSRLQAALNGVLAPEVVVLSATRAPAGFDARYSAKAREYRYRIDVGQVPDPFSARFVWHRPRALELADMRTAARYLVGTHDFASFGRALSGAGGTVRDLQRLSVSRVGDRIEVRARANSFIYRMVRSLVGTLVLCGDGKIEPADIPGILEARDRSRAGRVAPPHGLTLERVFYRA
jgi:tRNA pseudouridine38-40 synthase